MAQFINDHTRNIQRTRRLWDKMKTTLGKMKGDKEKQMRRITRIARQRKPL